MSKRRRLSFIIKGLGISLCLFLAHCSDNRPNSKSPAIDSEGNAAAQRRLPLRTEAPLPSSRIAELEKTTVAVEGPNCWNSALYVAGLVNEIRYVSKGEFWFWMKSDFCTKKPGDAPLAAGDIGSFFSEQKSGHYHSFIHLDDINVFSKNSPQAEHQYKKQNYIEMFYENYKDIAEKCRGNQSTLQNNGCPFEVVYYRCQPLPTDFYSRNVKLKKTDEQLTSIEIRLRAYAKNGQKPATLDADVSRLRKMITDLSGDIQGRDPKTAFVAKALALRMIGALMTVPTNEDDSAFTEEARQQADTAFTPRAVNDL